MKMLYGRRACTGMVLLTVVGAFVSQSLPGTASLRSQVARRSQVAANRPTIPAVDKQANPSIEPGDWPQWGGTRYRNNTPDRHQYPADMERRPFRPQDRRVAPRRSREHQVGLPTGQPKLRQSGNFRRPGLCRNQQRRGARQAIPVRDRPGLPARFPRVGRPVPLAAFQREAVHRTRPRLALPGHLLHAAGRRRPPVVRLQPRARASAWTPRASTTARMTDRSSMNGAGSSISTATTIRPRTKSRRPSLRLNKGLINDTLRKHFAAAWRWSCRAGPVETVEAGKRWTAKARDRPERTPVDDHAGRPPSERLQAPHARRQGRGRYRVELRHDEAAGDIPAQHVQLLCHDARRHPLRDYLQRGR